MKLPPWYKFLLLFTIAALFISGLHPLLVGEVLPNFVSTWASSIFDGVPNSVKILEIQAHGTLGLLMLVIFGAIFPLHVEKTIKQKRKKFSGILVLLLLILSAASIPVLFYSGSDFYRNFALGLHGYTSVILLVGLVFHLAIG